MKENKKCTMFRQTWYETSKNNLQPEERLRFYESVFEYSFFDNEPSNNLPFPSRLLFDMIKYEIDIDKERTERRANIARTNGLLGGRKSVTEENKKQENPTEPSRLEKTESVLYNTNTYTIHHNTSPNPTKNLRMGEESYLYFEIGLDFFERGCADAGGNLKAFWQYYADREWITADGSRVRNKLALGKAWRLSDCSQIKAKNRREFAEILHLLSLNEKSLPLLQAFEYLIHTTAHRSEFGFNNETAVKIFEYICGQQDRRAIIEKHLPKDETGKPFEIVIINTQPPLL